MTYLQKLRSIVMTTMLILTGCSLPLNAGCQPDQERLVLQTLEDLNTTETFSQT